MTEVQVVPGGTPKWVRDATLNDSDKSFTVPAGKRWVLKIIFATLNCTATVGTRNLLVTVSNSTPAVQWGSQRVQATANQRGVLSLAPGMPASTSTIVGTDGGFADAANQTAMPMMDIPAGYIVRVLDISAVDAAADDLTVVLHYIEYEA